jgi:hypothetical protein
MLGILESSRGNAGEAISNLRKAVELNPKNLRAAYQLAQETERQGAAGSEAEVESIIRRILAARPDNLAALLELGRIAAKRGDAATLQSVVAKIEGQSQAWPPEVQQQVAALKALAQGSDLRAAGTRTAFLRNALMRVPDYRQSLSVIKAPPGEEAQPFTRLLAMESPVFTPAPPDTAATFTPQPLAGLEGQGWNWIGTVQLSGEGLPAVAAGNGHEIRLSTGAKLPFPGGASAVAPAREGVLAIDFSYDFKNDIVLAGAGGVRLFRQDYANTFTDVTSRTSLPSSVVNGSYTGAWAADIDADGDLDIVLGTKTGLPAVLRNNGDGTFVAIHPFAGVPGLTGFAWGDFDGDGDADAALIDGAGNLHVFSNERAGQFRERALPAGLQPVKAIAAADLNGDALLDIIVVQTDGTVRRLSDKNGEGWDATEIARATDRNLMAGNARVRIADLDNNGALDLLLLGDKGTAIWLGDSQGGFVVLNQSSPLPQTFDIGDLDGDGRPDLLGLDNGRPIQAVNHGTKKYHWQVIRPKAAQAVGDQRVNSFGVGGEVEIRSGLLLQKQPITGPVLHFGLGEQTRADVVRIVWPNGSVSAEFDLKADQSVLTQQRLKGSCPFLFAFNGKKMEFVKDAVPWGSAIGLRINTLGTAQVAATEEWYKVGRDELVPHDGFYDLRITAELWETYYYDALGLVTVDHPAGTEVFVDERFVIPPAKLAITAVETPHAIVRAVDDNDQDVTGIVSALDGKYLDTFGRGQYQGITRDHYVELDLGDDVPASGPLWLIARGWMHPTDSSINVALSQGHQAPAHGLSLEVPDQHGNWVVAKDNLGFPAGRRKICLFDLAGVFRPGAPHRVRLRTNLEIYWDQFQWAKGLPDTPLKLVRLQPETADLHYRGYSVIEQPNPSSPEVPDYNRLEGSKQRWRDLVGYYTRFGDVRELLQAVDDRYVIMNSGDEMTFRFAEQPPPPQGWVRDFVVTGDGWIKDGDYNSTFSKTVLPLPYHARKLYDQAPGRLEDEWVYRRHPEDWQLYHTRYVTPDVFENSLRSAVQP